MKMRSRPNTISEFRKLGKRRLNGRTPEEAKAIHDRRKAQRETTPPSRTQTLPLGGACDDLIDDVKAAHPRLKNWTTPVAAIMKKASEIRTNNEGRYSSRCTFTHYTYTILIRSYATVYPLTGKLAVRIGTRIGVNPLRIIAAPRGYRWDSDRNGIRLVSKATPSDDYHPTAADLIAGTRHIVAMLKANRITIRRLRAARRAEDKRTRQEQEQHDRIMAQATAEGLSVCVRDSIRAGNCAAGSQTWAERHGFDPRRHYTPAQLLSQANGDTPRVVLAVAVALRRHRAEMERGYAELADHR